MQKAEDTQIHTELKTSERRLNRGISVQSTPAKATNADLDANERAEQHLSFRNDAAEDTLPRGKEPRSVASQGLERTPIPSRKSRHEVLQEPQSDIESVIEDLLRTSITTNTPSPQLPPRKENERHVAFALTDGSSSSRQFDRESFQDSPLDIEPMDYHLAHPSLPRNASPTQPPRALTPSTDTPASSISPLTLAWFDRIERDLDKGIALKMRFAEVMARQEEKQERESGNDAIDCSIHKRYSRVGLWRGDS